MSRLSKNIVYQGFYQVLLMITPLLTSPYVSRVLGKEGLGIYSYTYSVAYYFYLFCLLGINNYGNREIARNRDKRNELDIAFSEILVMHLLVSIIACIVYIVYCLRLKGDERLFAAIQGMVVVGGLLDVNWFFFGIEKFRLTVTRNSIIKILSVICVFWFVRTYDDLWIYLVIMGLAHLLPNIVILPFLKRYVSFKRVSVTRVFKHLKPLLILFIPVLAVSVYRTMDKIMIGLLSSKGEVGLYENSDKIIRLPLGLITAVGTVMLPFISNAYAKNEIDKAKRYLSSSMELVMMLAMALTFGIASISKEFAPIFWGVEFNKCSQLIQLGVVALPFLAFSDVLRTQYLIPLNKDVVFTISVCLGAVSNLTVNLALIPSLGAFGATIGTVISEIVVCSTQVFAVRQELPFRKFFLSSIPFIFGSALMFLGVRVVGNIFGVRLYTLVIEVVVGVIVFLIYLVLYTRVTRDEVIVEFARSNKYLNKIHKKLI